MTSRAGLSDLHPARQHAFSGSVLLPRLTPLGWWFPERLLPIQDPAVLRAVVADLTAVIILVCTTHGIAVAQGGHGSYEPASNGSEGYPIAGYLPAQKLALLGDASFLADFRLRYPYLAGAMANGIGSVEIVEAMGRAGMLGFFGAAGLPLERVEAAIDRLQSSLGDLPYGFNLIHSPSEPDLEAGVVDLYLRRGVRRVCASAYLDLTLPVVRYRTAGIHRGPGGEVVAPNHL